MGSDTDVAFTKDEIAGVVDLFGALTKAELVTALAELQYRHGGEYDVDAFAFRLDSATKSYHLVSIPERDHSIPAEELSDRALETADETEAIDAVDEDGQLDAELLVVGPVAFPELPDGADDLTHILDISRRSIDRETVASAAASRFREDVERALRADDETARSRLVDVSYELEAWASLDLEEERDRLR